MDRVSNRILVYVQKIEGFWVPYSGTVFRMVTNETSEDGLLLTYGEDLENQVYTSYIKIWKLGGIREQYENMSTFLFMQIMSEK